MRYDRFEAMLSLHGGDLAKWPEAMRGAAERLVARDARAARMLADAARLDHLLAEAVRPLPVDATMIGRIIVGIGEGARNGGGKEVSVRPTPRLLAWASAAMVASLVVGFVAGVALPPSQGEDAVAGLVFGSSLTTIGEDSGNLL